MGQFHRASPERIIEMYKTMLLTRYIEEKLKDLNVEGLIPGFLHLSIGQEAVAAGVMAALEEGDYILSTHRGHGHCLAKGMSEYRLVAEILGKVDGCCMGKGGSMHLCDVQHGIMGTNGIVGANIPIAAGIAYAIKYKGEKKVVACFFGDGASNTGAFHEGLNLAAIWRLPVIYVCENNLYAISTRITKVTLIRDIVERASSYGMPGIVVDGMDPLAVYEATVKAVERARADGGPALIECKTYRFCGSYAAEPVAVERLYRSEEEVKEWMKRDPIKKIERMLLGSGQLTEREITSMKEEIKALVEAVVEKAKAAPKPPPEIAFSHLYPPVRKVGLDEPSSGEILELAMNEAIRITLREEMLKDERIILMGEDIGVLGGDFRVTKELLKEFGDMRVLDTPISETGFVGLAIGAAIAGLKPVVEIMFVDFSGVCMDQIMNQAAKLRYMYAGQIKMPLVIRAACGGGIRAAAQHSQVLSSIFSHIPGLKVVMPSNPRDARGLLKSALREDCPVIFLEHKLLYGLVGPVPLGEYYTPIGEAKVVREGSDVTVVAYGLMVNRAIEASAKLKEDGISAEVIDLRTLSPLDRETIVNSVKRTGRLVIVEEDWAPCSISSEVAAIAAEGPFDSLLSPVKRVTTPFYPMPYSPELEDLMIPSVEKIISAVKEVVEIP